MVLPKTVFLAFNIVAVNTPNLPSPAPANTNERKWFITHQQQAKYFQRTHTDHKWLYGYKYYMQTEHGTFHFTCFNEPEHARRSAPRYFITCRYILHIPFDLAPKTKHFISFRWRTVTPLSAPRIQIANAFRDLSAQSRYTPLIRATCPDTSKNSLYLLCWFHLSLLRFSVPCAIVTPICIWSMSANKCNSKHGIWLLCVFFSFRFVSSALCSYLLFTIIVRPFGCVTTLRRVSLIWILFYAFAALVPFVPPLFLRRARSTQFPCYNTSTRYTPIHFYLINGIKL